MTGPHHIPLTPGQRRHVEGSLRQLDAEIEEAIQWFRQRPLPEDARNRVLSALAAVRERIEGTARRLQISVVHSDPDPARRLAALAGHWWGLALDCRSSALRGYGELDPGVDEVLDPMVHELATELLGLGGLLAPSPDG